MKVYKKIVFFALFCSANLFAESYLDSEEIKQLLNKIETASVVGGQNEDLIGKELQDIEKKINLANQKRNLEGADSSTGLTEENIKQRADSLQSYYSATESVDEFIYSDNFSYQVICKKNINCKPTALVESEIFNQKIQLINEKIANNKSEMVKGLKNIYPLDDKVNIIKQMEQTTYSANSNLTGMSNTYTNTTDSNKIKKFIELNDGDILGKVKITITQTYIKLSRK